MTANDTLGHRQFRLVDAVGLAVTVILAGLTGFVFVRASLRAVAEMREEQKGLEEKQNYLEQLTMVHAVGEEEHEKWEGSAAAMDRRLPRDMSFPDFYDAISDLAETHDVLLSRLEPGPTKEAQGYREMSVSIGAVASFEDFYLFLFDVGSLPRVTKLDSLSIRATQREQLCNIDMAVRIFAAQE